MMKQLRRVWAQDDGQDLIEYALIAALVALICVAAITLAGNKVSSIWNAIAGKIPTVS